VRSETLGALDGDLARRRPLLAAALATAGGAATGFALVRILRSPQRALRLVVKTFALARATARAASSTAGTAALAGFARKLARS
jgi:hypothetical protein